MKIITRFFFLFFQCVYNEKFTFFPTLTFKNSPLSRILTWFIMFFVRVFYKICKPFYFIKNGLNKDVKQQKILSFNHYLLQTIGIRALPNNTSKMFWLSHFIFYSQILNNLFHVFAGIDVAYNSHNLKDIIGALTPTSIVILTTLKYFKLFYSRKKLLDLLEKLQCDWNLSTYLFIKWMIVLFHKTIYDIYFQMRWNKTQYLNKQIIRVNHVYLFTVCYIISILWLSIYWS